MRAMSWKVENPRYHVFWGRVCFTFTYVSVVDLTYRKSLVLSLQGSTATPTPTPTKIVSVV